MTVTDQATKAQKQILDTIEVVQDRVLEANQKVAERINERMEGVQLPDSLTEKLPSRSDLPDPSEAVDTAFDFVEKITKDTRQFASELVKAWTPESAPEQVKKAATSATATAKKTAESAKSTAKTGAASATATAKKTTESAKATAKKTTESAKATAKKTPAKKTTAKKAAPKTSATDK